GTDIRLAGQNVHWEPKGAYTGEIAVAMLRESGCTHVIVGHSERRQHFGETNETVNRRLHACLGAGLVPIVCVGETLAERVAEPDIDGGLVGGASLDAAAFTRIVQYQ